jgi:hypothetical protein
VQRIGAILPSLIHLPEVGEVRCKGIAVPEDNVLRIVLANYVVNPIIPFRQTGMLWINGLVERVVARYPRVRCIVFGEFVPEPKRTILKVLVFPEEGEVSSVIGMPAWILATRRSYRRGRLGIMQIKEKTLRTVHVENGVDPMLGTDVNHSIEVFKALWFENPRVVIVLSNG